MLRNCPIESYVKLLSSDTPCVESVTDTDSQDFHYASLYLGKAAIISVFLGK
jgi:hypothetical protein